jgi:hypothetical protein
MLRAVGYDRKSRIMEVLFNTGQVYQYENVPSSEFNGLLNAKSKGEYMHANIIDVYPFVRLRDRIIRD